MKKTFLTKAMAALHHGFSMEQPEVSSEEKELAAGISKEAKKHHLEFPVLIFLEGIRPAAFLASSLLTGLEPFAELFLRKSACRKLISLIGNKHFIDSVVNDLGS